MPKTKNRITGVFLIICEKVTNTHLERLYPPTYLRLPLFTLFRYTSYVMIITKIPYYNLNPIDAR